MKDEGGSRLEFIRKGLGDVTVVTRKPFTDERGSFGRVTCEREFAEQGLNGRFVQTSLSVNKKKGTLRGLHYLLPPHEEDKLVACIRGRIFDVCVDVRPGSSTYGRWTGEELSGDNGRMLYIPKGFAHGFVTLEDDTELMYYMTTFYEAGCERGYMYDDPRFGIRWPGPGTYIMSEKDRNWRYCE